MAKTMTPEEWTDLIELCEQARWLEKCFPEKAQIVAVVRAAARRQWDELWEVRGFKPCS